ncbi:PaaI family thioesterase [Algiphilus sp.]|uniref:PaaI family thioesterase n=1 Tax=Algiphilus sp. TaxID=1872431 RepID=UPI0032EB0D94
MPNLADAMPFATLLGIEVSKAKPNVVVGTLSVRPDICTVGDIIHGGALMAFADSLGAIGAYLNRPEGAEGTITIESKSNFIGRAEVEAILTGTSTPVSVGKRLSVWQTRITSEDENLIALITQTQLVI